MAAAITAVIAAMDSAMHAAMITTRAAAVESAMRTANMPAVTAPHEGGQDRRHFTRRPIRGDRRRSSGVGEGESRRGDCE
jgi:hypothetical protein